LTSRCAAAVAAGWLLLGCGRLIGIDAIAYTPDAGEGAETRDAPSESGAFLDREVGTPGDAEAGADGPVESGDDASDGYSCDAGATQSDKHNCGRCGHDCLGGECRGGRCAPLQIAGALAHPLAIAASNDGFVYWVDGQDGTIRRASKAPSGLPKV